MKRAPRCKPFLIELKGGPFAGTSMRLNDSIDTATFVVNGRVGFYKDGQWIDSADEPAPVPLPLSSPKPLDS